MGLELTSELLDSWTLVDEDVALMARKSGATRARFAVLLTFFSSMQDSRAALLISTGGFEVYSRTDFCSHR